MCGIVAYIGNQSAVPLLLEGLKKLEYRGYDSAGICITRNHHLEVIKRSGKISELEKVADLSSISSHIGIAHTRWATHGAPNEINAHPHLSCHGEIAIVHNGIIENFRSLKDMLIQEGHRFSSETDSEVLAHLIEKFYEGDLAMAVVKALHNVEGTFGIAVMHQNEERLVIARRGSPIIIGLGNHETIVASDAVSIIPHTKKVIYLKDNEIAVIGYNDYRLQNLDGQSIASDIQEIRWNISQIEKRGFKHFMLKEIFEQPEAVQNTLRGRITDGQIKLSLANDLNRVRRIIIAACGTSWHSALIGKNLIEKHTGIPTEVDYASEFRYRESLIDGEVLMVVISQSGETADTLAALRKARAAGTQTLGIVNVVGSTIAREVDSGIYLHAGPEIGVASTKAFICQVIALLLLALYIRQQKGERIDPALLKKIETIPEQIRQVAEQSDNLRKIATAYYLNRNFLYLGRGINYPVALEGALKLKEISYIHAEGYPAAEMKHGPIALIDENMPVVFIATKGAVFDKVLSNMQEVKARGGIILTITDHENPHLRELSNHLIIVPETDEDLSPLINVVPLQLLAYHIADMKGLNVDKPRNLAKSVTVE
ncbi:MAG TPA: glutamine--fructose-6-phosphate transaminase (isomerizing) [Candidatus Marinimicrobia bacterium]|nr:glutamine--fructose-6-phosphate transaminase (isomerizing) [Candidatus Neomarinimicrobiota bacterium]HRS51413.1 glutamine--fructose-6-phosphate transaminase (isomerizing) [Candidatus Neomarinimicrobiota bacterium]HRU92215.1 glutamine--fructose-6-phosphate transaminase (isomerizing) [Candidatus Neomarinimicrobiota bacterium]